MRNGTLTARIAALLLAAATGVFALTALAVDRLLERELAQRDARELVGKIEQLRHLLRERADVGELRAEPQRLADIVVGHDALGFTVSDGVGGTVARAGVALDAVAASAGAAVPADRQPVEADVRFIVQGKGQWRVLAADARLGSGRPIRLLIGRDVHPGESLRSTLRNVMLAGSLTAAFGTALVGWLAVWRGIRPLAAMAAAARRITTNRLAERVEVPPLAAREVKELAEAFNQMTGRLEEGVLRLSQFSADLAHDLRTPLATLMLQAQVGLSRTRSAEEYQQLLAANVAEFERLQRMVDGMLFLARADSAQVALKFEPVELHAELRRIAEYFELAADERGVQIAVTGEVQLQADAALVSRALGNLVANAVRHAREGSTVRLRAWADDVHAVVEVANDGPGIAPEDLPHVFDRFWRGDRARSASQVSSGLGLSIVRSVARLHGGDASVESSPEGPTTFRLRLRRRPLVATA